MLKRENDITRHAVLLIVSCITAFAMLSLGACSGPAGNNDAAPSDRSVLIPYRKGDKWGYSDAGKKLIIPPKYRSAEPFVDGLARVCLNESCGFIDKTGNEVIPLKYTQYLFQCDSGPFHEGLAVAELDHKCGYIDKSGNVLGSFKYDSAKAFSEGIGAVELESKRGYIDKTGKEIVPLKYYDAKPFSEGLAATREAGPGKKFGYIDTTGKQAIPARFDSASSFHEGLAGVCAPKCGFIDKTGKAVVLLKYYSVQDFSEGLAAVEVEVVKRPGPGQTSTEFQTGYIDKTGKEVIPRGKYSYGGPFSEGLACVQMNGKFGYIDKQGNEVIPFRYSCGVKPNSFGSPSNKIITGAFSEGLAFVIMDKTWGYIDKSGNQVTPFSYAAAHSFFEGLGVVELKAPAGYHPEDVGYVGKDGTEYFEP